MARQCACPKCGADISDTHLDDDPDCGITAGWVCEKCNIGVIDEYDGSDEMDFDR